jgi:hypothetical protein
MVVFISRFGNRLATFNSLTRIGVRDFLFPHAVQQCANTVTVTSAIAKIKCWYSDGKMRLHRVENSSPSKLAARCF